MNTKIQSILNKTNLSAEQKITEIAKLLEKNEKEMPEVVSVSNLMETLIKNNFEKKSVQIHTGLQAIDVDFKGIHEEEIWVFGGRPGMGTNLLICTIAQNILRQGLGVLHISAQYPSKSVADKYMSIIAGISSPSDYLNLSIKETLKNAAEKLQTQPLFIADNLPCKKILEFCNQQIDRNNIKVIIIDWIQALYRECSAAQAEAISKGLYELAQTKKITIIIGSEISNAVEKRAGDKKPYLMDFKLGSFLENFATNILAVYRPEYYGLFTNDNGKSTNGMMEVFSMNDSRFSAYLRVIFSKSAISDYGLLGEYQPQEYRYEDRYPKSNRMLEKQLEKISEQGDSRFDIARKIGLEEPQAPQNNDEISKPVQYYIQKMDIEMLDILLTQTYYQDLPKALFLSKLSEVFKKLCDKGDRFLYAILSNCTNCFIGKKGYIFVGNNSGHHFNLLFLTENNKLQDLHECSQMKLPNLEIILNDAIRIHEKNIDNDSPF